MIVILRPFTIAGIDTTAYIKLFMLFPVYFNVFMTPEPVDSFEVYKPSLFPEFYSYSAIAIPWMLYIQDEQIIYHSLILIR